MKSLSAMAFAFSAIIHLFAVSAVAQDLHFDDYRKFLMSGSGDKNSKKMAIQTTCTTASGQITRIGEIAYDKCLSEVRQNLDLKTRTNEKDAANTGAPAVGTTIHIGN